MWVEGGGGRGSEKGKKALIAARERRLPDFLHVLARKGGGGRERERVREKECV